MDVSAIALATTASLNSLRQHELRSTQGPSAGIFAFARTSSHHERIKIKAVRGGDFFKIGSIKFIRIPA